MADRFFAAAAEGDLEGLEALLAEDVVLHGDGGGKMPAIARPLHGARRVARTLVAWARAGRRFGAAWACGGSRSTAQPGAMALGRDGRLISVMALEIAGGRIRAVSSVVNPDKLRHLGPVDDTGALLRRDRSGAEPQR